jgi:hypothetical protein
MALFFDVQKSKKSKVRRLGFLPRIGITLDFGGKSLRYKQAPILETVFNAIIQGPSKKTLTQIVKNQFKEIKL